jgi:Ca2+-binding RTX toxin-like protein
MILDGPNADVIFAGDGQDHISVYGGGAGDDTYYLGPGQDFAFDGGGNDVYFGGSDRDRFFVGFLIDDGDDSFSGGQGKKDVI